MILKEGQICKYISYVHSGALRAFHIDKEGKEVSALYGTPGLELFSTAGVGPVRGCYNAANGRAFVVANSGLYELDDAGTATLRGTLDTTISIVTIDDNGLQLFICDGANGYIFTFATDVFAKVTDGFSVENISS